MRQRLVMIPLLLFFALPLIAQEETPPPVQISDEAAAFYEELITGIREGDLPEPSCELFPFMRAFQAPPDVEMPEGTQMERLDSQPINGAWFTPPDVNADEVMLYIHGGGFMLGSVFGNYTPLISWIADRTGYPVLAVEYALAPENPYPAGLEDVQAAYAWLLEQGYTPSQIVIAGDSAGGNLALELLLGLRDAGEAMPSAAWLYAPAVDFTQSSTTYETLLDADPTVSLLAGGERNWRYCYTEESRFDDPAISPIFAELNGLPPLLITVGTREALLGEISRFAQRARAADVDVTLDVWDGMWHTWALDDPTLPESFQLYDVVRAWLDDVTGE